MDLSEQILGIPGKFVDLSEQIHEIVRKILGIPTKFMDLSEQILGIPRKFVDLTPEQQGRVCPDSGAHDNNQSPRVRYVACVSPGFSTVIHV